MYGFEPHSFSEQHNKLILRIKVLKEKARDKKTTPKSSHKSPVSRHIDPNPLLVRTDSDIDKAPVAHAIPTKTSPHSPQSPHSPHSPQPHRSHRSWESSSDSGLETLKEIEKEQKKVSAKEIDEEKSSLRLLFRQIYNAVRMLEDYRSINTLACFVSP